MDRIEKEIYLDNDWIIDMALITKNDGINVLFKKKQINGPGEYQKIEEEDLTDLVEFLKNVGKWEKFKQLKQELSGKNPEQTDEEIQEL
jgi:hypothetical protein